MSDYALALASVADESAVVVRRGRTATAGPKEPVKEPSKEKEPMATATAPKLTAEIELVDKIAAVFREKSRWEMKELEAKGVTPKHFKRPFVVAHLAARHGLMITAKRRETVFIAVDIGTVVSTGSTAVTGAEAAAVGEDVLDKSDYFWMPPEAKKVEQCLRKRMTVLLWGPPGSGKTTMLERLLQKIYGAYHFMSLHGDMSRDDFYGTKELKDGTTYFRWGPASEAMRKKEPLIFNELDAAPPEILFCLQRVLEKKDIIMEAVNDDDGKPMRLQPWHSEEVTTEKIVTGKKDPEKIVETVDSRFCIGATANTIGRGDDTGLYRGAQILNEAFLDRFDQVIYLGYPPPRYEAAILHKRTGIDPDKAKEMVKVADAARKGFKDERRLNSTFSVRKTLNWARSQVLLGDSVKDAFISTILSRVTAEDRTALAEMYQRVYGERINVKNIG